MRKGRRKTTRGSKLRRVPNEFDDYIVSYARRQGCSIPEAFRRMIRRGK